MDMLALHSKEDYASLKPDSWEIPSLSEDSLNGRENALGGHGVDGDGEKDWSGGLDLILMPGMAFDEGMGRLGHGRGFYDFFLQRFEAIALANEGKSEYSLRPLRGKLGHEC